MINDDMDDDRHEASSYQRVELITGRQRRRQWTAEEKADIVCKRQPAITFWSVGMSATMAAWRSAGSAFGCPVGRGM